MFARYSKGKNVMYTHFLSDFFQERIFPSSRSWSAPSIVIAKSRMERLWLPSLQEKILFASYPVISATGNVKFARADALLTLSAGEHVSNIPTTTLSHPQAQLQPSDCLAQALLPHLYQPIQSINLSRPLITRRWNYSHFHHSRRVRLISISPITWLRQRTLSVDGIPSVFC